MARENVATLLHKTGMPVVYMQWPDEVTPEYPCLEYHTIGRNDLACDNSNYFKVDEWLVALYAERKDEAMEALVEQTLENADIVYSKSEDIWIDSEKLLEVDYVFQLKH